VCPLEPHAVDILTYFMQHRDRVVTKRELLKQLWPGRFVGEGILAQRVMTIRKAIARVARRSSASRRSMVAAIALPLRCRSTPTRVLWTRSHRRLRRQTRGAEAIAPQRRQPPAWQLCPAPSRVLASRETPDNRPERRGARPALFSCPPHFVGRDAKLAQLGQWWSAARQGMRQVGFIVGEPGIGKTALVDAFVAQVAAAEDVSVGCGQCVDDYGMGET
jgi:hypothetical protein